MLSQQGGQRSGLPEVVGIKCLHLPLVHSYSCKDHDCPGETVRDNLISALWITLHIKLCSEHGNKDLHNVDCVSASHLAT